MDAVAPVNYFSYGSNLSRENFSSRYKGFGGQPIKFNQARVAVLQGWALAFNAYFCPPAEPVMASIDKEPGAEVHGILYEIPDLKSWETLVHSESGSGVYYQRVEITVHVDGGTPVQAVTFVITELYYIPKQLRTYLRPSERYLNILLEGAEQEKLSVLVERLKAVQCARKPSSVLQVLGLGCAPWMMYASSNWLRFTMQPYSYCGARLFYVKEKLAEDRSGNIFSIAAYYAVSLALLQLTFLYFFASLLRLLLDAEMRTKASSMLRKMLKG